MFRSAKLGKIGILMMLAIAVAAISACCKSASGSVGKTVTLYTSDGIEDYYKAVLPDFEKKYNVKVNMITDGSGAVVNRLTVEKDSPKADVVVTMPPFVQTAQKSGLLEAYNSPEAAAIPDSRKDKDGYWQTFINNYVNFVYNPTLTKTPPATFDDLLGGKYKDQLAYSNPISAGDGMAFLILLEKAWGEQKAFDYLKKLEANVKFHTKGTGYLNVLVNRGEIQIANGDLQMDMADKNGGGMELQPLLLKPSASEPPITFEDPYVIGLVNHAPNSKGGKLLIDYLLSKDAQTKTYDIYGLPARNDIKDGGKNAGEIDKLLNGVKVVAIDWNHVLDRQKAWQDKWQSEVLNSYGKQGSVVAPK